MLKWWRLTSLFIAWSKCDHIFANPPALLKWAFFEIFGIDTAIEGILGCFEICIVRDLTCLLFLTILKLLLKHWYLMRLLRRTVLVVLWQKPVVVWVVSPSTNSASSVCLWACVARVETINGCRIHRQDICCRYLLLLLWTYISTHHQQAWLASSSTGKRSVILAWLHYYAVIQGWIKTVGIGCINSGASSCSTIIQSLLTRVTSLT